MATYTTLDKDVLDLERLTAPERTFLDRCLQMWRSRTTFEAFESFAYGPQNPVLDAPRRISRDVAAHPLYRAVHDLADRLGVLHGVYAPATEDERPAEDPINEDYVSLSEAARLRGASVAAVHAAIKRGELIGQLGRPARVSVTSLDSWKVDPTRQRAGRILQEQRRATKTPA